MERSGSSGMSIPRRAGLVAAIVLLLGALASADDKAADARDLIGEVKAHEEVVAQHCRDKAYPEMSKDIKKALAIYESIADHADAKKAKGRLVKLVGNLCRKIKKDDVRKTALATLAKMHHPDCAKYVKGFLHPAKGNKLPPMINEAMAAAGALGHDSLVLPLLKIVENSKNLGVAARAVTALGNFRDSAFSRRKKILLDLTDTLMKDMPGGPSQGKENRQTGDYIPGKSGHGGSARYATLAPLIPQALNELTGQEFQTLEEWMRVVSEQKRNLQDLFLERDEEEKEKKDKKRA